MQLVIRKYHRQDKDTVRRLFSLGILEQIHPCFYKSLTSPLHLAITLALCAAGFLLGCVPGALVLPGFWIGLLYYCCHRVFSGYVQAILQSDMDDIPQNFLSTLDDCFWVAEAKVDGRTQIVGTAAVKTKQSSEGRQAELFRMIVSSSCRRMGLGVRMAKTVIDFCKERGISELVLETSSTRVAAIALYKKLGFSIDHAHTKTLNSSWIYKLSKVSDVRMKMCLYPGSQNHL